MKSPRVREKVKMEPATTAGKTSGRMTRQNYSSGAYALYEYDAARPLVTSLKNGDRRAQEAGDLERVLADIFDRPRAQHRRRARGEGDAVRRSNLSLHEVLGRFADEDAVAVTGRQRVSSMDVHAAGRGELRGEVLGGLLGR